MLFSINHFHYKIIEKLNFNNISFFCSKGERGVNNLFHPAQNILPSLLQQQQHHQILVQFISLSRLKRAWVSNFCLISYLCFFQDLSHLFLFLRVKGSKIHGVSCTNLLTWHMACFFHTLKATLSNSQAVTSSMLMFSVLYVCMLTYALHMLHNNSFFNQRCLLQATTSVCDCGANWV